MRPEVSRSWLWLGAVGLLLVGVAGLVLLYLWGEPVRRASGHVQIRGLADSARIRRDAFGVPHIEAANAADGIAALGFAHAQDRYWQMEVLRRTARGTLSELFGPVTLGADRLARTLGLVPLAEAEAAQLSKSAHAQLTAYSAGVNGYLEQVRGLRGSAAVELRWLGMEAAPWTVVDSLALLRLRAWMLGRSLGASLLLDRLVREIGGVASQEFFPELRAQDEPEVLGTLQRLGETADALARVIGLEGRVGSLGFAIGARRSRVGAPLLANDPHVAFHLPPLFYAAHLATPDWEVAGGTWPGLPVFWTGTNREIAWGQVAVHASVSDLFEETLHPRDPYRYRREGRWRNTERKAETIPVRGRAEAVEIEVVITEHGPLLGSVRPDDAGARTLALGWTGHGKRSGIEALLSLQRAHDWDAFRTSLSRFPGPVSSFLYADRQGRIGRQLAGRLPIRAIETGLLPVPGRSRYYDWRGFIPFKKLPSSFGADIPWIVAATHPDDLSFPNTVTWLWSSGGAADRLRGLLAKKKRLGLDEVVAIQRDQYSERGVDLVRRLIRKGDPEPGPGARVRELLLDWDGETATNSLGVSVYHVFRQRLASQLLEGRLGVQTAAEITSASEPLPGIVLARFIDRAGPRQGRALVERALEQTWSWMRVHVSSNPKKWTWGQLHRLRLQHDFERLGDGLMGWFGRYLGRGPFPVPGDADSVWTMHHLSVPTTHIGVGPAFRYAVDLADTGHALFGLAGGQSGHPAAAHYDDALQDWVHGRPRPLWMHASDIARWEAGMWELSPPSE